MSVSGALQRPPQGSDLVPRKVNRYQGVMRLRKHIHKWFCSSIAESILLTGRGDKGEGQNRRRSESAFAPEYVRKAAFSP